MKTAKERRHGRPLELLLLFALILCGGTTLRAQMLIDADRTGRKTAHPAAALEVISTSKGVIIPRLTRQQRQAVPADSAAAGLLVYQSDGVVGFYLYDGKAWKCLNPVEMPGGDDGETPDFAEVAFTGDYSDLKDKPVIPAAISGLSEVAFTGSYNDLTDKPAIPVIKDSTGKEQQMDFAKVALSGDYNDLSNLPEIPAELKGLSKVAFTGSYKDLSNLPKVPTRLSELEQSEQYRTVSDAEYDRWSGAAERSVPTRLRDLSGDTLHMTVSEADKAKWNAAVAAVIPKNLTDLKQDEYHRTIGEADKDRWNEASMRSVPTRLSELASDFNNLLVSDSEKQTWTETSLRSSFTGSWNDVIDAPKLAAVATSGNVEDLSNLPKIPTKLSELMQDENHRTITDEERAAWNAKSNFNGSWNNLTDKPNIPTRLSEMETDYNNMLVTEKDIARWNAISLSNRFSGDYNDLTDKPTIPTRLTDLEQDDAHQLVTWRDTLKWNRAATFKVPEKLSDLKADPLHMTVEETWKEKWDAHANTTIPTNLQGLEADDEHQFVTTDEKKSWQAAADKTSTLPTKSDANRWQAAANKVDTCKNKWNEMYETSLLLRSTYNGLTTDEEDEYGNAAGRLHAVAFSGDYGDLKNTPAVVPTATEIQAWLGTVDDLEKVAFTGSYTDLKDKPVLRAGCQGDVLGSMEDGFTLKENLTLKGATTISGTLQATGEEGSNPKISIEATNNIKILKPLSYDDAKNGEFDNYAVTVGLSRELDARTLRQAREVAKTVVPEGTIAMWSGDKIPPCWEPMKVIAGRFPVGAGKASGITTAIDYSPNDNGGNENHTLTLAELPSHSHTTDIYKTSFSSFANNVWGNNDTGGEDANVLASFTENLHSDDAVDSWTHLPPYRAIYFIKRSKNCP